MFLPKMWLRLEEAKDRLKTEKNINVSESDILHLVISGNLRAYALLVEPIYADCYRIDLAQTSNIKHCGCNIFRFFLPISRTAALDIDIKGFSDVSSPAIFINDPLEGFDEQINGEFWKISPPLQVKISSIVVLRDDLFEYVESFVNGVPVVTKKADKPLADKERESLIKIIYALAKNGYKYPERSALADILKDFELNKNGVSENTLTKYLKAFDSL